MAWARAAVLPDTVLPMCPTLFPMPQLTITILEPTISTYCPTCDLAKSAGLPFTTTYEQVYGNVGPTGWFDTTYTITGVCTGTTPLATSVPPGFTTTAVVCTACSGSPTLTITTPIAALQSQESLLTSASTEHPSRTIVAITSPQTNYNASGNGRSTTFQSSDGASKSSNNSPTPSADPQASGSSSNNAPNKTANSASSLHDLTSSATAVVTSIFAPMVSTPPSLNNTGAAAPAPNISSELDSLISKVFSSLGVVIFRSRLSTTGIMSETPSASTIPSHSNTASSSALDATANSPTDTPQTNTGVGTPITTTTSLPSPSMPSSPLAGSSSSENANPTSPTTSSATRFTLKRDVSFAASLISALLISYMC
ncbi:hypothetical protein BP5796_00771 [Coleophoma crateriformis]|uniref:Uncharacterized protein n=1 Tax=Coleophoma crateriformis TaxID=565419 RepID=A0A3D8TAV0_9HELO|nr:hypothetical protein BP5796_00771 [Coleophoma crateriformis]